MAVRLGSRLVVVAVLALAALGGSALSAAHEVKDEEFAFSSPD